jgi:protein ImuA
MNSLHRQEIFAKLRSRFATEVGRESVFAPAGTTKTRSHSPARMLETGLHECLGQGPGDWASVLGFVMSAAGRAARESGKPAFILRLNNNLQELGLVYGFGLSAFGLDPEHVISVSVPREKELLWAAEEIVVSQGAGTVVVELGAKEGLYGFSESRRLKLRTETSKTPIFVLRHWSQGGATAAHSRWRIARLPSGAEVKTPGSILLGAARLSAMVERCQTLPPSTVWEMESHASRGFGVAALLANGASRTASPSQQAG